MLLAAALLRRRWVRDTERHIEVDVRPPAGRPAVLKSAVELAAAADQYGIGAADGTEHSGPFQTEADDGFTTCLNEGGLLRILLEILGSGANLLDDLDIRVAE